MKRLHTLHYSTWVKLLLALLCTVFLLAAAPALPQPQAPPPSAPTPTEQTAPPSAPAPAAQEAPPGAPSPAPQAAPSGAPAPSPQATPSGAPAPAPAPQAAPSGAPAPTEQAAPPGAPAPAATSPAPAATPGAPAPEQAKELEAFNLGVEAYIFGYPLVTMEMTRRVLTNVAKPEGKAAPMGQFARLRAYPTPVDKEVTAPNADTLYTLAWLDVTKEPWLLSLPGMKGRYYMMPMLSGWTDVFQVPGTRTTGTKAQTYAITGPGWQGTLPEGVTEYKSPTGMVWILGRIYCTGTPKDYKAVHALQDKCKLAPLSSYGKPYTPPPGQVDPAVDLKTPVREQVNALDAGAYFKLLVAAMKDNQPAQEDIDMVAKLAKIGIVPGQDFDMSKLDPTLAKGLERAPKAAQEKILAEYNQFGVHVNGWQFSTKLGVYGTDYLLRAITTWVGLGANRPLDAIYPVSGADADGQPYDGAHQYVVHFDKGQMPPAKGFWSLTMYDAQYFFVENPLKRYTLSSRNKFKTNQDGSVDLYLQNESPGKAKEPNWLPAPKDRFVLMFRLYWPYEPPHVSILDSTWKPPVVKPVK